MKLKLILEIFK